MTAPTVIILAAGRGTRMKSAIPKVLHPVAGQPMLEYVLRTAAALAPARTVAVVGHRADLVEAFVAGRVAVARQDPPRGTGDAVRCALAHGAPGQSPVVILSGDTPLLRAETVTRLLAGHVRSGATLTLTTTRLDDPVGYGRIVRGGGDAVAAVVEERDATPEQRALSEVNAGVYVVEAAFLVDALKDLTADNAQGEYYLTDVVGSAVAKGLPVRADVVEPTEVLGINSRADLARVEAIVRERIRRRWMAEGVTMLDPARVLIDAAVTIGPDTVLAPDVWLEGDTTIGARCTIGPGSHITASRLGDGVTIKDHCVIGRAVIEDGAVVGPFAHLRPDTVLRTNAHVGNFVELKKTELGAGSKANHLSYLGDATIGANVNIGAGTITCNYDGERKHRTAIEDGVFVGSDTQFVAPVRIGKGAVVAAGATVTADVPEDALVISRVKQIVKPGWAKRLRDTRTKRKDGKA